MGRALDFLSLLARCAYFEYLQGNKREENGFPLAVGGRAAGCGHRAGAGDVLSPHCSMCGPFDSDLLGNASVGASALSAGPSSGSWNLDSNVTAGVGTYDNPIAYMFHNYYGI